VVLKLSPDTYAASFLFLRLSSRRQNNSRAGHEWIRGFLAGSSIYVVAPNFLNILQFFSCKSIKN
jgi:hypothetical protein